MNDSSEEPCTKVVRTVPTSGHITCKLHVIMCRGKAARLPLSLLELKC